MSAAVNLHKHYKTKDMKSDNVLHPPTTSFIPKSSSLKTDNNQEFTLHTSKSKNNSITQGCAQMGEENTEGY
eukprot:5369300-Ditylum_brightwellii.AAC.1